MHYFLLIGTAISMSIGQILFKLSSKKFDDLSHPLLLAFDKTFILALFFYGISTIMYVYALRFIPLNKAYMFMSIAFIIVPFLSYCFLCEPINLQYIIGILLIIGGVILTARA
jgi:drug/metabolite transporter (DMT)-like permease